MEIIEETDNAPTMVGAPVEKFIDLIIKELTGRYLQMFPMQTSEDFYNNIVLSMDFPNVSGDKAANQYLEALKNNIESKKAIFPLVISVAYCLQAQWALDACCREKAWSCIAEAQYWCGSMLTKDDIEISLEGVKAAAFREKAVQAVNILHDKKYGDIKKRVTELATSLKPKEGWKSRRDASIKIFKHLEAISGLSPLTPTQGQITIEGWLKHQVGFSTRKKLK